MKKRDRIAKKRERIVVSDIRKDRERTRQREWPFYSRRLPSSTRSRYLMAQYGSRRMIYIEDPEPRFSDHGIDSLRYALGVFGYGGKRGGLSKTAFFKECGQLLAKTDQ